MKKILFLLFASCMLFSVVTCTKKSKEQPVVVFNNGDTIVSVDVGAKQEVLVNINAPGQLEEVSFFYMPLLDTVKTPVGESVVNFSKPKRFSSKVLVEGKPENYYFVVKAKDKNNQTIFSNLLVQTSNGYVQQEVAKTVEPKSMVTNSSFKDIHTTSSPPSTSMSNNSTVPANKKGYFTAGFNKNTMGSSLSIANLKNKNAVQQLPDAKKNQNQIDLMFFYGSKNGVTLTSPVHDFSKQVFNQTQYGTQTWTTKKTTFLTKNKSNKSFAVLTLQDAESSFDSDDTEKFALNHLKENDIIFFQTDNGIVGAIHIKYVGENNRSVISFDVKVLTQGDAAQNIEEGQIGVEEIITDDIQDDGEPIIEEGEEEGEITEEEFEEEQIEVQGGDNFESQSSTKFNELSFSINSVSNPYTVEIIHLVS